MRNLDHEYRYFQISKRSPSLRKLTLIMFDLELTHLGSEASSYSYSFTLQVKMNRSPMSFHLIYFGNINFI